MILIRIFFFYSIVSFYLLRIMTRKNETKYSPTSESYKLPDNLKDIDHNTVNTSRHFHSLE